MARLTRAEAKTRTRERLLDAARRLFLEHGYAATSMEEIAQDAGVTKAAIYRHFPSKQDLFLALRQRSTRLADVSPLGDSSKSYEQRLAEVGRRLAHSTDEVDPRVLALQLEFRALSLRQPEARQRFADEIRALVAAASENPNPDEPALRKGVTEAEVIVLGQLLIEGLAEYRAFVPDIVTEQTFGTAFSVLAQLTSEGGGAG